MAEQENKDWLDKLGEFSVGFLLIQTKTLPILFVNEAMMRSRFEIPFLMVMLVDLFVLF